MKDLIRTSKRWVGMIIVLGLLVCHAAAESGNGTVAQPGAWCSQGQVYGLSAAQKEMLQTRLQRITGWTQLSFAENGKLELGDLTAIEGGSLRARLSLLQALRSGKQFVIEDHSLSGAVNFGQLDEGTNYTDERIALHLEIYRVRLDFADFEKISATPEVKDSFDEGFTFLHELLHGLGLKDTHIPNEIGECETIINEMRAELGLPLRAQYLADLLHITPLIKTIRLRFREQSIDGRGLTRWKTRHLFFTPDFAFGQEAQAFSPNANPTSSCLSLY